MDGEQGNTSLEAPTQERVNKALTEMPKKGLAGFVPKDLPELERLSKILAGSEMVPKDMRGKPANVMLAIMHGMEVGVTPAQALCNIMVINGRASIWGDLALGIVRRSTQLAEFYEWDAGKALREGRGYCKAKRANGEEIEFSFTMDMAKAAHLDRKQGPWQEYRGRMLQMRSRAWVLRDLFGDVLKGLAIVEEQRDVQVKDAVTGVPMPKRASDKLKENAVEGQTATEEEKPEPEKHETDKPVDKPGVEYKVGKVATVAHTSRRGKEEVVVTSSTKGRYFTGNEELAQFAKDVKAKDLRVRFGFGKSEKGDNELVSLEKI